MWGNEILARTAPYPCDFRLSFQTLSVLYQKILRTVSKMPEESAYRKYTEETTNERLAIVKSVSLFLHFLPRSCHYRTFDIKM